MAFSIKSQKQAIIFLSEHIFSNNENKAGRKINKRNIINKAELPTDVLLGDSIIEIYGKNEIIIENYGCLTEITDEKIVIKCKFYTICIIGKELEIEYYNNKICMKVLGIIYEISFD